MRFSILLLCFILSACSSFGPKFSTKRVEWRDVPGWSQDNFREALPAILKTCEKAPKDLIHFCQKLNNHIHDDNNSLRRFFESNLTPYAVYSYGSVDGKITGYYEAELTGTRTRENGVQVPIYGRPDNYVKGQKTYTREEIETSCSDAPVLAWADDPVELFIAQIQGSGRMTTPSGEVVHLGYAGDNGYPFTGIGSILRDAGIEDVGTMPKIRTWLQSHPKQAEKYMRKNKRYIYFREVEGDSPYGTAQVVLTPMRSVAVDETYIPMHTLMFLSTQAPDKTPIRKMVVAQDTGAAIRGGIRADYFWGHGERAFQSAGQMNQTGRYFILKPKG